MTERQRESFYQALGAKLRIARAAARVSNASIAARMGCTVKFVELAMAGTLILPAHRLVELADAISGTNVEELWP
jgi:hypothetical protein